jgi:serine/threonine-protein kinase
MEPQRACKIMIQTLGALEEAHNAGVVHRDLKPENILLTTQGGIEDFPKVLDFGLAKIKEQSPRPGSMVLTREGMVFGTPEFMSPEQARGETLDGRSDIYSLGVIFFELLTARLPFPRCKPMEYIAHHINTPPFKVSEVQPELGLPRSLDSILGRALEKKRENRYQSAREFAEAVQAVLPHGPRTAAMRAVPLSQAPETTQRTSTAAVRDQADSTPAGGGGKGIVIALLAVIAVLFGAVLWLVLSGGDAPPNVVPLQAPPAQAPPPVAPPPSPDAPAPR